MTILNYLGLFWFISDYMGISGTIWDYLGLYGTRVQVEAGESKLLLFETFFSPTESVEELALLKIYFLFFF